MPVRPLAALEARVLGVLVEKAHTVPDSYPLSLNSLTLGCNQKTARTPVMAVTEAEVQGAVDALKVLNLAFESSGSRVRRYEHNMGRALGVPSQSVALLATLVLRGPQTTSELRANAERLHRFADLSSAEGFLEELASRPQEKGGPLALKLQRAPGSREPRWAQLLCGEPPAGASAFVDDENAAADSGQDEWKGPVAALQREVADLREQVERLCRALGVAPD